MIKKIIVGILIAIGISFLIQLDKADRSIIYSRHTDKEEFEKFSFFKTDEEVKEAYAINFDNPEYLFPRAIVKTIKIYKNSFLISRLNSRSLDVNEILGLINDPNNFSWDETIWTISDSEYIIRFFDAQDTEVGVFWFCVDNCFMTESIPFSPSMKFGAFSKKGIERFKKITKF